MQQLQDIYQQFLAIFPSFLHPFVSIALGLLIVYSVFQIIKKNFIFLIVLIVLLPASIPILKQAFDLVVVAVKFLFRM